MLIYFRSVKVKELMVEHAERFKHLSREQMANEIYNMLEESKYFVKNFQ